MGEVRKPETLESYVAGLEERLRKVEAAAARTIPQTLTVELSTQFRTVTSGTFSAEVFGTAAAAYAPVVVYLGAVNVDAGTIAEVRLTEAETGAVANTLTLDESGWVRYWWLHPVELAGPLARFQFEARRVSGAGNVVVFYPRLFQLDSASRWPDAAADGGGVFFP